MIEPDYLWHISAGDYMFHHGILTKDVFSWYLQGHYWMSHEWLFEIIIFSLKNVFGRWHLILYLLFCIFGIQTIFFLYNRKNYMKNIAFSLLWVTFFLMIIPFVQVRPHMISFGLLALTVYFLYDLYLDENSRKIYFLPAISILWANVHGGSSNLPYLLCFLFIFAGFFQFQLPKIEAHRFSKKQFLKYFVIMLLCMVAVCFNIHGVKMFLYPYENMADSLMIKNIGEWRSSSLNELSDYLYFGLVLVRRSNG